MHMESIKVFCDVVHLRSFSLAGQANDVTQSAVSQIVGQLERRLGVQLIDRTTRPLRPTPSGQAYFDGCRAILEQFADLERRLRPVNGSSDAMGDMGNMTTHVRVAAIYSVGLGDMHEFEEKFASQNPSVQVHVDYLHPDRVYADVEQGSADFGLVSFPRKTKHLVVEPWREETMVLACPPRHRLARKGAIRAEQLDGEKFVGFDRGLIIRREVDRFLRERHVAVNVIMEFDNIETIKKAVEIGAGVALLPEPTVRKEVESRALVGLPLAGTDFVRPLGVIHRKSPGLSAAARRFLDLLRQPILNGTSHDYSNRP